MSLLTTDTFFNGRIQINQSRKGYRFSIDAVLLANLAKLSSGDKILDLGTGCGIIPLILAYRQPDIKVFGVEIQTDLAEIATENVRNNSMEDHIHVLCKDMKQINQKMTNGPVDLVLSNPPFRKAGSGRINPESQRAIARHEITVTLPEVIETAGRMVRTMGKVLVIYPAERLTDVLILMRSARIEPKNLYTIHSKSGAEAKLVVVEGAKGGQPGIKVSPPVYIYKDDETYSEEVEKMFQP